jgi:hypothetical protein
MILHGLKDMACEVLVRDRLRSPFCEHANENSASTKCEEYFD